MKAESQKIKETIEKLLEVMDFLGVAQIDEQDGDFLKANIQSAEAAYLIGRSGENLLALQHLSRAIVNKSPHQIWRGDKKEGTPVRFIVDVNDYQKNRFELVKEMAASAAKEVARTGQPRWLAPMNAYERRIIHVALADVSDIKTESEGAGEGRRIVIKPI